jgi:hypothetical protein
MYSVNKRGMGDIPVCPSGASTMPDGSACADDLTSSLPSLDATVGGPNASASINVSSILANLQPTSGETFLQWVNNNSTVLLVGFAAIGAFMAIAGGGRRR